MNVRLLGFRTLACGCVIGQYRELATSRELKYVEEKGTVTKGDDCIKAPDLTDGYSECAVTDYSVTFTRVD